MGRVWENSLATIVSDKNRRQGLDSHQWAPIAVVRVQPRSSYRAQRTLKTGQENEAKRASQHGGTGQDAGAHITRREPTAVTQVSAAVSA